MISVKVYLADIHTLLRNPTHNEVSYTAHASRNKPATIFVGKMYLAF